MPPPRPEALFSPGHTRSKPPVPTKRPGSGQFFPDCGVWVSVDFDSEYKILWGETRAHGVPIHEEEEKVPNKNQHNCSNISTPYSIRLTHVGVEGVCFLADCL